MGPSRRNTNVTEANFGLRAHNACGKVGSVLGKKDVHPRCAICGQDRLDEHDGTGRSQNAPSQRSADATHVAFLQTIAADAASLEVAKHAKAILEAQGAKPESERQKTFDQLSAGVARKRAECEKKSKQLV